MRSPRLASVVSGADSACILPFTMRCAAGVAGGLAVSASVIGSFAACGDEGRPGADLATVYRDASTDHTVLGADARPVDRDAPEDDARFDDIAVETAAQDGGATKDGSGDGPLDSSPDSALFTVGGTVTGLQAGWGLTLQDNGGDNIWFSGFSAPFTFGTALPTGHTYAVTILGSGESCTVVNGTGTIADADVTNVVVPCVVRDQ